MAKIKNIIRGDTKSINITYKDASGNPVDLSTYSVFFTVKAQTDSSFSGTGGTTDSTALIQKGPITGNSDGTVVIPLTASDTDIDPTVSYYYDIQFKDGSGNITSVPRDLFLVVPDVTRRTT